MVNEPELLRLLEIAAQRVRHHHNALWEEEKHYSWWIYIIFAVLIYLYFKLPSVTFLDTWQKILLIVLGSLFGFFISIMGYYVVRREGEYFHEAIQIRDRIIIALGLNQPIARPDGASFTMMPPNQISIKDWNSVRSEANKSFLGVIGSFFSATYSSLCGFLARVFKKKSNKSKKNNNKNFGIRDGFQLTFLITALLFIVFGIFSVLTIN